MCGMSVSSPAVPATSSSVGIGSTPSILRAAMVDLQPHIRRRVIDKAETFVRTASSTLPALPAARTAQARMPWSLSSSSFS